MGWIGTLGLYVLVQMLFLLCQGADFPSHWINTGVDIPAERTAVAVEPHNDEIYYFKKWKISAEFRKASTIFMVKLFNVLQMGLAMRDTSSERVKKADLALSDTIRSFSAKENLRTNGRGIVDMHFRIPYLPHNERLRLAEVRCVRHSTNGVMDKKYKVKVDVFRGDKLVGKFSVRTKPVTQDTYDVFDISRALTPWINGYHGNITVNVKLPWKYVRTLSKQRKDRSESLIVFYLEDHEFLKKMYESYTYEEKVMSISDDIFSRGKRASRGKNRRWKKRRWNKARKEGCHLYDFDVDFKIIGWSQWIIHPKRFNSKLCYGNCPSPIDAGYKPTNHAMLQSLMKSKRKNVAPPPCCVPTKLKPLSMLYFEYDEIVVRHHEDMIATECGCR